ncbi:MAG: histidine kinase [Armatimonadota bacterium]|nr:histidine kinase [Armatimonadota bacterium]
MRLHLKISLWTLAILLVVGGISIYALYAFQRRAAIQQFETMAQTLTETILNSLEITMLHNNQEEMREIIRLIRREQMIRDVTIFARTGKIWASTDRHGDVAEREAEALAAAVAQRRATTLERGPVGELVVVTPVVNKPACQACHARDPEVLGAISVSLETAHVTDQLRRSAQLLATLVGFAFLFALGMLNLLLGRFVLDPLATLAGTVRQIASGEYRARTAVRRDDELGLLARSVNEMAERIERYTAALNTQIGDLTQRLASLGIFGRALTEAADLSVAMQEMTAGLVAVLEADVAAVYLCDGPRLHLAHHTGGVGLPEWIEPAEGTIGAAVVHRRPVQSPTPDAAVRRPADLATLLAVPLLFKERRLGLLLVGRRSAWPFAEADLSLLVTLSDQLAIAIENVRLFDEVRAKEASRGELLSKLITAHEDERRRLARELHDEVSQSLTSLMITIRSAENLPAPDALREKLERLYRSAEATLAEVGKVIHDLRPTALDDLGLVSAVRVHARNLLETAGVKLTFEASGFGRRRLPPAVEATAFRVAQEAITNVARHANATAAFVSLRLKDGTLALIVEDNGVGFDPAQTLGRREGRRAGLLGMHERAALIGGTLAIDAKPGRGTRVTLEVPVGEDG